MRKAVLFLAAVSSLTVYAAGPTAGGGSNGGGGGGSAPAARGGGGSAPAGNSGGGASNAQSSAPAANNSNRAPQTDATTPQNIAGNKNVQAAAERNARENPGSVDLGNQRANTGQGGSGTPGNSNQNNRPRGAGYTYVYPWANYYGGGYYTPGAYGPTYYNDAYGNNTWGNAFYPNGGVSYRSDWDSVPAVNVPTNADANTRAQIESARADMDAARQRLASQFRSTHDFVQADKEAKEAQAAYDAAVRKVRSQLRQSDDYRDAVAQKRDAQQHVEAVQAAHRIGPTTAPAGEYFPQQAVNAAQQKLNAAKEVTNIEREQFEQDPAVREARERLDAAVARVNQLKHDFDAKLANDPQWSSAKAKLDSAMSGSR